MFLGELVYYYHYQQQTLETAAKDEREEKKDVLQNGPCGRLNLIFKRHAVLGPDTFD